MTFDFPTIRGIVKTLKEHEVPDEPLTVEDAAKIIDALAVKIERLERQLKNSRR